MRIIFFTILLILLAATTSVFSQPRASMTQAIEAARSRELMERSRSMELDRIKREAETPDSAPAEDRLKISAIKDDFQRIQVTNADGLQANSVKAQPDYKAISKAAVEIKRRALRLKSNLFPSDSKEILDKEELKKNQDKFANQDIKKLAIAVDNTLYSFISNKMFHNIKLRDLEDSNKAKKDLDKIVILCSIIETKSR